MRIVATTSDLASLAQAVAGDLAQVETIVPPAADPEAFEPRPSDLVRLKGASIVIRVGLGYDDWLNKLLMMHGGAAAVHGGIPVHRQKLVEPVIVAEPHADHERGALESREVGRARLERFREIGRASCRERV